MLFVLFCKPVDVIEGISLRASCFDGGISIVLVVIPSKSTGRLIATMLA
jgi:hypothetical protein